MRILVTGALGNVGKSTVRALLARGDRVTAFEADRRRIRRAAAAFSLSSGRLRFVYGDIRDSEAIARALVDPEDGGIVEAVCHLAAVIPPAADKVPGLADSVNTGGTAAVIAACRSAASRIAAPPPRIILASSIAVYGDRLSNPWIRASDEPAPDDVYGKSKLDCEILLRSSGLPWTILRLTYIVSSGWIKPDPMLFDMPVSTKLEVCHTEDAGRAFAGAAHCEVATDRILDIGGGSSCRTVFRSYIDRMFRSFGLGGSSFLPDSAFARGNFHCGWYADSDEAEAMLGFRTKNLEDYYSEVLWKTRVLRFFASIAAPLVKRRLLASSPYFTADVSPAPAL